MQINHRRMDLYMSVKYSKVFSLYSIPNRFEGYCFGCVYKSCAIILSIYHTIYLSYLFI